MSGLPTKTVTIDGFEYEIMTLDALKARPLWVKLFKAFGPGIEAVSHAEGAQEIALTLLGKTLAELPEELVMQMSDTFAASCTVKQEDGKRPFVKQVFAIHFAGRPGHFFAWLLECCKVNFADFLDGSLSAKISALVSLAGQSA